MLSLDFLDYVYSTSGKCASICHPAWLQVGVPMVAILAIGLMVAGFASRRFDIVDVYCVTYSILMMAWPFADPRFWLPILPWLIAYFGLGLKRLATMHKSARYATRAYVMMFVLLGVTAMVSNTALSFSGDRFADRYDGYHSTYCAVWTCKQAELGSVIDIDGLRLLHQYKQNQ